MLGRELVQRLASQSASGAVQRQLRLGNADLANANLAKEGEIAELRNQIAIIRWPKNLIALLHDVLASAGALCASHDQHSVTSRKREPKDVHCHLCELPLCRGIGGVAQSAARSLPCIAFTPNQTLYPSNFCRSSEYALAKEAFDEKMARQAAVLEKIAPAKLIASLAASAEALDEEADALYEKLVAGDVSVEAFQQQHLKLRQAYHVRDIKRQAAEQTLL